MRLEILPCDAESEERGMGSSFLRCMIYAKTERRVVNLVLLNPSFLSLAQPAHTTQLAAGGWGVLNLYTKKKLEMRGEKVNIFLHRTQGPGGAFEENRTNCRVALFLRSAHCEFFTSGQIVITSWFFLARVRARFSRKFSRLLNRTGAG